MELNFELLRKIREEFHNRKNEIGEKPTIEIEVWNWLYQDNYLDELDGSRSDIFNLLNGLMEHPLENIGLSTYEDLERFYIKHFKSIDQMLHEFIEETGESYTITETPYYSRLVEWSIGRAAWNINLFLEDLEREQEND